MKISRLVCLLVAALMMAQTAFSSDEFRIEDYKPVRLVDFQWKLEPGLESDNSEIGSDVGSAIQFTPGTDVFSNSLLVFGLRNTFDYYDYSLKRTWNIVLSVTPSLERRKISTQLESGTFGFPSSNLDFERERKLESSLLLRSDWYVTDRFFLTGQSRFLGTLLSSKDEKNSQSRSSSTEFVRNRFLNRQEESFNISAQLGFGVGRTFDGRFGYLALEAIQELEENGLLSRELSKSEFVALAERMYQSLEVHSVDSRLRRIDALSEMTNWLSSIGVISEASPLATLLLLDVWEFYPQDRRLFGVQARFNFGAANSQGMFKRQYLEEQLRTSLSTIPPGDTIFSSANGNDLKYFRRRVIPFFSSDFIYEKPINQKLQLSLFASIRYNLNNDNFTKSSEDNIVGFIDNRISTERYKGNFQAEFSLKLSKIVSSRTRFDLIAKLRSVNEDYNSVFTNVQTDTNSVVTTIDSEQYISTYSRNGDFALAMEYRIAVPTTITAEIGFTGWIEKRSFTQRQTNGSVLFGIGVRSYIY